VPARLAERPISARHTKKFTAAQKDSECATLAHKLGFEVVAEGVEHARDF